MRTNRSTGCLWFLKKVYEYHGWEIPDTDSEHIFFPGLLVKQSAYLEPLRQEYSKILRRERYYRMLKQLGILMKQTVNAFHQPINPGTHINREIIFLRMKCRHRKEYLKKLGIL